MRRLFEWDVKISDGRIKYFDPKLSYEATGYRPIDDENGLDFNPKWFTKDAADIKRATGKYCPFKFGTKPFRDYWTEQGWRCREGYTVNGYTITGDNYYFINFYQLLSLDGAKAGKGREFSVPDFYVEQYKYFHYVELCRFYGYNGCTLKCRGIGWSEINACLVANMYTWRSNTRCLITSYSDFYVSATVKKAFYQLDYNNSNTEGGMRRLRQVKDREFYRRSSHLELVDGGYVESGQKSEIVGLVVDEPRKMRSDRVEILLMDEGGSWANSEVAYEQAKSLVTLQGERVGNVFIFGTGGDKGPNLSGLKSIFTSPKESDVLGYKHNYTKSGETVVTGFFVPAFNVIRKLMDNRGYVNEEEGRKFYEEQRNELVANPKKYRLFCAENCFCPEEALALEGDGRFDSVSLTEQKARILIHKSVPEEYRPKVGRLEYTFADNRIEKDNITGVEFIPDPNGNLIVIEPPITTEKGDVYKNLYVAGIDGIDLGNDETEDSVKDTASKFCIVIKKRMMGLSEPMYVAMYMARPERIREAYIQALRLIMWYNAKAMIEKTRIGFLSFMEEKKMKYRYMMHKPKALEPEKESRRSNIFGAPATEQAIKHGLSLIADYVMEYAMNIWFIEMIDQLISYSYKDKRKYDIVAAMQMAELADEELSSTVITTESNTFSTPKQISVYGWYRDEKGYMRRGRVDPNRFKQKKPSAGAIINFDPERYGDGRVYTSNPVINGNFD